MTHARRWILGLGLAALAAGCAETPDYPEPPKTPQAKPEEKGPKYRGMNATTSPFEGMVSGEVIDADLKTGDVTINLGFDDVDNGWMFEVRRGSKTGELVGLIEVVRVGKGLSRCNTLQTTLPIQRGDTIISK
jgi:hypothetical protein